MKAINRARAKRAEAGPISGEWDVEDHLVALNARLAPLKSIGTELLDAGIHVYRKLWPGATPPDNVSDLAQELMKTERRLREWRSSAARAGADQTLSFILSWYEGIDLQRVRAQRENSAWTTDSAKIQLRRDAAHYFAGYSQPHQYIEGEVYSDDEDYAEDVEDEEEDDEEEAQGNRPDTSKTSGKAQSSGKASTSGTADVASQDAAADITKSASTDQPRIAVEATVERGAADTTTATDIPAAQSPV